MFLAKEVCHVLYQVLYKVCPLAGCEVSRKGVKALIGSNKYVLVSNLSQRLPVPSSQLLGHHDMLALTKLVAEITTLACRPRVGIWPAAVLGQKSRGDLSFRLLADSTT
jgi:hypothetical protein